MLRSLLQVQEALRCLGVRSATAWASLPAGVRCLSTEDSDSTSAGPTKSTDGIGNVDKDEQTQRASGFRPRLRSLAEVFQSSEEAKVSSLEDDVIASLQPLSASGPESLEASTAGKRSTQQSRPGDRLISSTLGYAAVSGSSSRLGKEAAHPSLHPRHIFIPGDVYNPEDLNPYASSGKGPRRRARPRSFTATSTGDLAQLADFKNVSVLEQFLTSAGKLAPRKATRLPILTHVKVMKEIKRARQLGLMSGEARPEKRHLPALREAEERAKEMQQQASV